ncbi:MAG: amino acid adenylation domain-containing protein, partial [Nostoc indistinguendum CM1-VF10]|nr:amino acid adenylation domain-containing protein [Nostoc indistinguendum CM1-VF10]
IVANPEQRVSKLPLLTTAQQHQLLVEWNDTQADYPKDKCIHQLFEVQVQRTPDAVAVVFEEQQLTYRELNQRANQLAHRLQCLGVGPEVLVGICVERSLEMVVGLLGILKAGGAYVPLDPAYAQERLAFMLSDSQVPVLLIQERLIAGLPEHDAHVVCLDTNWELISQESEENPISEVTFNNLAYVIYTSGSTGKPKGVQICHGSLVNFLNSMRLSPGLTDQDILLAVTTICFDIAALEIYLPLIVGAQTVIASREVTSDGSQLLENIAKTGATAMQATPATWRMLLAAGWDMSHLNSLSILCGGEALTRELANQLLEKSTSVWNLYGPTETTIWSAARLVEASGHNNDAPEPIGRPIANTQIYILDRHLQPVPIGVAGELHIGGEGLARGYLNRRELTDEKFIPNPFNDEPGARLYKTGDLARYLPDGNIEFLGRLDHQVKIRGFRIELGEIEAVLGQHPGVQEIVVVAWEDKPGNKRLVAYFVPDQQHAFSDLRSFLKEKLPDYMVPSAFVELEKLPLTPNGKVDRRALPTPEPYQRSLEASFVPPRTPTEEVLAAIWTKVLGLEQVGIYDNFFELGGDSILSIQVVARANQAGLQLTPKQIFQYQTIAELTAVVGTTVPVRAQQELVTGAVPLTPIQHWFFEQNLPYPAHFNQSVLLEVPPDLKPKLLKQVVQQLLVHHDALRLRFAPSDSGWQQVNAAPDETVPFTVVDLSELSSGEQPAALEATVTELQASLNLSEGPVMRVALFHFGIDQPGRLLLIVHHLAVDGVSWRILLEDLTTAYQQLNRGSAIQLPPKTTAFKDWAERLTEYGQSETLAAELDYWLAESRSGVAPLSVEYPSGREANTVASAAQVSVSLSVEQTNTLLQEVPSAYNTQINDVLLTALVQSFAQWTGERSLLVNLEGHGREELFEDVDLSRTVGWFTTVFPVLLDLGEVDHPGEALKSVKEQLRRLPKRGIGHGLLRYLSQDAATRLQLQALPQAEVSFNYLGQFDQVLSESALLRPAKEPSGSEHSPLERRSYLLEVNGFVALGRLQLNWTYSEKVYQRTTVERLALEFIEALKSLIAHCQLPEAGGYTPWDFPDAALSQEELEELVAELSVSEN